WAEPDVARLYRYRAPYPPPVFEILRRLIVEPHTILDAGCGTGALTRHLTELASRVDAVDPSEAMIEEGRRLLGGGDPRIRWIVGPAETAPLEPPYGLITTGQSLHRMDQGVVTLGERTAAFAAEVRALFASLGVDRVAFPVAGSVVWGRPLRP